MHGIELGTQQAFTEYLCLVRGFAAWSLVFRPQPRQLSRVFPQGSAATYFCILAA